MTDKPYLCGITAAVLALSHASWALPDDMASQDWDDAVIAFRASRARIRTVHCRSTERVVVSGATDSRAAAVRLPVTSRDAELALDDRRHVFVIREHTQGSTTWRELWHTFDGHQVRSWTRSWDDDRPGVSSGRIGPAGVSDIGRLRSELTPLRFLGKSIRGSDLSLQHLLSRRPVAVSDESVDGARCIVGTFELPAYEMAASPILTVRVFLDRDHQFLPRRIHCRVAEHESAEYGTSPAVEEVLTVTEFLSVIDRDTQSNVLVPFSGTRNTGRTLSEVRFDDIRINAAIRSSSFRPSFPFGCRITDRSDGTIVRFQGGKAGQRQWMEQTGIEAELIDRVLNGPQDRVALSREDFAIQPAASSADPIRSAAPGDLAGGISLRWVFVVAGVTTLLCAARLCYAGSR